MRTIILAIAILFAGLSAEAGTTRFMVFKGDSLTEGWGASPSGSNYVSQMHLETYGVITTNLGVGAQTLQSVTNADDVLSSLINFSNYTELTAVLLMGINDVANARTFAQITTNYITWGTVIRAAYPRIKLVGITIIACGTTDPETVRTNVNYWITNSTFFDYKVDAAARFTNSADTTLYDEDTVHLNNNGYAVLATLVRSNLLSNNLLTDNLYLPASRRVSWVLGSTVGVRGGIPDRQTIYTNLAAGSSVATINTAIQNCPSNQVVKLGAGTFNVGSSINLKNGVTLRGSGSGAGGTLLSLTASANPIEHGPIYPTGGTVNIATNGYAKDATNITVASAASLSAGEVVLIDQVIDSSIMWSSDGSIRGVSQLVIILSKSGNDLVIWPPLHYGLTPANTPQLHKFTADFLRMSGVEDFKIDLTTKTSRLYMLNCLDCWAKNIQIINGDSYCSDIAWTLFFEFTGCNINSPVSVGNNHGGILVGETGQVDGANLAATAAAIYDNITLTVGPGIEFNSGSSGCLVSYNFCYQAAYDANTQLMGICMNHSAESMMNLYEGNLVNMLSSDGYFGGSLCDTVYRNWAHGYDPDRSAQSLGIAMFARALQANIVGNVVGCTNLTNTVRFGPTNGYDWNTPTLYAFGQDGEWGDYDAEVTNTMIFHSNWDSNLKAVDWGTNSAHSIPDSLYLTSKPTWFGYLTWPPFSPTNGYTNLTFAAIPAGYRYLYGTNPPAGDPGPVASPRRLRVVEARVGTIRAP